MVVRPASGKVYQGWVHGYSDGDDQRELLLRDVFVYGLLGSDPARLVEVNSVPVLYLGIDPKNAVIGFQVKKA